MSLHQAIVEFVEYLNHCLKEGRCELQNKPISNITAKSYLTQLNKLLRWDKFHKIANKELHEITTQELEAYLQSHARGASVRKVTLIALRQLGRAYGNENGFVAAENIKIIVPKQAAFVDGQFLTPNELKLLLTTNPERLHPHTGVRSQAMIAFIGATIADNETLQHAKIKDIQPKHIVLPLRAMPKNIYQAPDIYMKAIHKYIKAIPDMYPQIQITDETPLFFSVANARKALSRQKLFKYVDMAINSLGFRKIAKDQRIGTGIQNLRVSFARMLYAQGIPTKVLKTLIQCETDKQLNDFLHLADNDPIKQERKNAIEFRNAYQEQED